MVSVRDLQKVTQTSLNLRIYAGFRPLTGRIFPFAKVGFPGNVILRLFKLFVLLNSIALKKFMERKFKR
jgi:hypothetical protein